MIVNVNMSIEVYSYFKGYDMSALVDTLLDMYDFTCLPPTSGVRDKEVKVNVNNETYISMYNLFGSRSKKVSLGRLFEFAFQMDVLALPRFKVFEIIKEDVPTFSLLDKAYKALLTAQKYDKAKELKAITDAVYAYREIVRK